VNCTATSGRAAKYISAPCASPNRAGRCDKSGKFRHEQRPTTSLEFGPTSNEKVFEKTLGQSGGMTALARNSGNIGAPQCKARSALQGSWGAPQTRSTATALAVAPRCKQNGVQAKAALFHIPHALMPNPSFKPSPNSVARRPSSAGPAAHFALAVQRATLSVPA